MGQSAVEERPTSRTRAPKTPEMATGTVVAKKRASRSRAKKTPTTTSSRGKRNKVLGRRGEDAAAQYLVKRGYEILERNWTCFAGEADIIARDGDILVFVEVKTRSDERRGFASEAVTKEKRQRYEKIACTYVADHEFTDMLMRFDVLGMLVIDEERFIVRHHINAFCAGEVA